MRTKFDKYVKKLGPSYIIRHNNIRKFVLAGKSHFTVVNTKTKNHFRFFIIRPKDLGPWFVWAANNKNKYCFLGTIFPRANVTEYKYGIRNSKFLKDSLINKSFDYLWKKILFNSLPNSIVFYRDVRCGRCGQRLTNPKSIKAGFGPYCLNILRKEWKDKKERYA